MHSTFLKRAAFAAVFIGLLLGPAAHTRALDGASAPNLTPDNGWLAFELVTQGNNVAAISDPGYGNTVTRGRFDGLGTYLDGNKLSIAVNHETSNAAIGRVDVDRTRLRQAILSKLDAGATPFPSQIVTGIGYAYDRIFDGTYHAVNNPTPAAEGIPAIVTFGNNYLDRFCAGTSYLAEAFGPGRGLVDRMYLTGEEVSGGKFYATDQATRTMWEVPSLGLGSWENAAQVDTGDTTHVALVLNSDLEAPSSDYLRLYVGAKGIDFNADGTVDFLERNGLRGGSIYYFKPDEGASTTDLPNGTVSGVWSVSTTGALREDKLEDIHTNPDNGNQLAFNDQTDGVYRLDLPLVFTAGEFDPTGTVTTISQIDDGNVAPLGSPDNLAWSLNGKIYVEEDGDGFEIWAIDESGGGHVRVAQAFSEPSGVIDASEELGFLPGSVLLSSVQGTSSASGSQLIVLISPTAAVVAPTGDYNKNGVVDAGDYTVWRNTLGQMGSDLAADGDGDNKVDADDYDLWKSHFGESSGAGGGSVDFGELSRAGTSPSHVSVPEPMGVFPMIAMLAALATLRRP